MLPLWIEQEVEHVWSKDTSIDSDNPNFDHAKWIETGDDQFLPLKAGEKPTVFVIKGVSREVIKRANAMLMRGDAEESVEAMDLLIRHGVVTVRNCEQWVPGVREKDGSLKQSALSIFRNPNLCAELGIRIQKLSMLPEK